MRVGLHSGPGKFSMCFIAIDYVEALFLTFLLFICDNKLIQIKVTAGVLRGQNSRFQLFGDTMNTGKIGLYVNIC